MNSSISRCASSRSGHRTPTSRPSPVEDELALGQVEIERIAASALDLDDGVRGIERLQHAFKQRRRRLVRPSVDRGLGLLVR